MTTRLSTTYDMYRDAADRMNRGRGKTITVPRQLFVGLVLDHGRLVRVAESWGVKLEEEENGVEAKIRAT